MLDTICHDFGRELSRSVTHLKFSVSGTPFPMGGFLVSSQLDEAALTSEVPLAVSPVHFPPLAAAVLFVRHLF